MKRCKARGTLFVSYFIWGSILGLAFSSLALAGPTKGAAQTIDVDDLQRRIFAARDQVAPALVNVQPITDVYSSGERRSSTAIGSGFMFDDQGHVVTNYHVAGKAKRLIITLSDRQRVPGVLVGGDPSTDIAVLKVDVEPDFELPDPVALGDSNELQVGQYVMALGSPLALQRSLSFGVVSSKDRYLSDDFKLPTGERRAPSIPGSRRMPPSIRATAEVPWSILAAASSV